MRAQLVEQAMRGDQSAFETLAAQSVDRCYALAYRILRDPHRAEDATQQALLGAWRDLPSLKHADRFDAWLYRLVVHACYVEARGTRRWNARAARVRFIKPASDDGDPATEVADRDELNDAFRRLSPEHRAVVVLHHHLGYSLTEIAATLAIPEGTARSRLHYGVRHLRGVLDREDGLLAQAKERSA